MVALLWMVTRTMMVSRGNLVPLMESMRMQKLEEEVLAEK